GAGPRDSGAGGSAESRHTLSIWAAREAEPTVSRCPRSARSWEGIPISRRTSSSPGGGAAPGGAEAWAWISSLIKAPASASRRGRALHRLISRKLHPDPCRCYTYPREERSVFHGRSSHFFQRSEHPGSRAQEGQEERAGDPFQPRSALSFLERARDGSQECRRERKRGRAARPIAGPPWRPALDLEGPDRV